ncbi:hypothetical protein ABEB36_004369 [Hypothenemus hampei]|uniref:Uncharacterized protein n=1 Tax=Hypothenemus hampei TaxID=57062 RepID=A0ABD1F331_HYPHA
MNIAEGVPDLVDWSALLTNVFNSTYEKSFALYDRNQYLDYFQDYETVVTHCLHVIHLTEFFRNCHLNHLARKRLIEKLVSKEKYTAANAAAEQWLHSLDKEEENEDVTKLRTLLKNVFLTFNSNKASYQKFHYLMELMHQQLRKMYSKSQARQ